MGFDVSLTPEDKSLYDVTKAPQKPQGFWDKFVASNSDGKVFGMSPDKYAMLAGGMAHALAPDTPMGRLGLSVANYGLNMETQRRKEQEPAYREGTNRINATEEYAKKLTEQPSSAVAAPQPSTQPNVPVAGTGFGARMAALQTPQLSAPVAGTEQVPQRTSAMPAMPAYMQAEAAIAGQQEAMKTQNNPLAMAKETAGIENTQAHTRYLGAETEKANTEQKYIAPRNEAEIAHLGKQNKLLDVETALAVPKFEFEKATKRAELGLQAGHLALGRATLAQTAADREESRAQRMQIEKGSHLQTYGASVKGLEEREAKDLSNELARNQYAVLFNYGQEFMHKGLEGYGYAMQWETPQTLATSPFITAGKNQYYKGLNNSIAGINSAPDPTTKKNMYHQLMKSLDPLKKANPDLYTASWNMIHNGVRGSQMRNYLGDLIPMGISGEVFDPRIEAKQYNGGR